MLLYFQVHYIPPFYAKQDFHISSSVIASEKNTA
jgi:hypothetical protein